MTAPIAPRTQLGTPGGAIGNGKAESRGSNAASTDDGDLQGFVGSLVGRAFPVVPGNLIVKARHCRIVA
jgi:hypothetical protein